MKMLGRIGERFSVVGELLRFFWKQKLWWMLPMVFIILLFTLLIIFGQATGVAPFIYTLF